MKLRRRGQAVVLSAVALGLAIGLTACTPGKPADKPHPNPSVAASIMGR